MASEQYRPVVAPPESDRESLNDFSQVIQENLERLYELVADVQTSSTVPTSSEGAVGSVRYVLVSGTWRQYIKVDLTTWKYVALS